MRKMLGLAALFCLLPSPAPSCSLCVGTARMSLVYEFDQAAVVVYGTLANPKLDAKGRGTTELLVQRVIKDHREFSKPKVILLSRYLPVDAKNPVRYVMFFHSPKDSVEPYWGKAVTSPAVLDFVARLQTYRDDPAQRLLFAAKHFDHADSDVADEAFMLFAKADDKLIAKIAPKLSPVNLRRLVRNRELPAERVSMFAYLLGACGNADDTALLRGLLKNPEPRMYRAYDGILAGYITARPKEGWAATRDMLTARNTSFLLRFAAMRAMRFYYNAQPKEAGPEVMAGMNAALAQPEVVDIAIEDLRKWQRWDHTKQVLAAWDGANQSPLVKQSIIRYALACPLPQAKMFIEQARRQDPETVRDIEQELK